LVLYSSQAVTIFVFANLYVIHNVYRIEYFDTTPDKLLTYNRIKFINISYKIACELLKHLIAFNRRLTKHLDIFKSIIKHIPTLPR